VYNITVSIPWHALAILAYVSTSFCRSAQSIRIFECLNLQRPFGKTLRYIFVSLGRGGVKATVSKTATRKTSKTTGSASEAGLTLCKYVLWGTLKVDEFW